MKEKWLCNVINKKKRSDEWNKSEEVKKVWYDVKRKSIKPPALHIIEKR